MIKTAIKKIGGGFIYGVKHPFEKPEVTYDKRHADMNWGDFILDGLGMTASQGTIQWAVSMVGFIGFLMAVGYINSKLEKAPVNVKMVVDKKEAENK